MEKRKSWRGCTKNEKYLYGSIELWDEYVKKLKEKEVEHNSGHNSKRDNGNHKFTDANNRISAFINGGYNNTD